MVGLQSVCLEKGQFVFGRKKAATELNLTESNLYKLMKRLENLQMISINSNNKFSIVTVEKYELYQDTEIEKEQQSNNKVTTKEQQSNTNKNKRTEEQKNIYKDIAIELIEPLKAFEEMRKKIKAPLTDKARTMLLNNLNKLSNGDNQKAIAILNQSTMNCWKGVFPLKENINITKSTAKQNKFHNFEQTITTFSEQEMEEIAARNNKKKLERLGIANG